MILEKSQSILRIFQLTYPASTATSIPVISSRSTVSPSCILHESSSISGLLMSNVIHSKKVFEFGDNYENQTLIFGIHYNIYSDETYASHSFLFLP